MLQLLRNTNQSAVLCSINTCMCMIDMPVIMYIREIKTLATLAITYRYEINAFLKLITHQHEFVYVITT